MIERKQIFEGIENKTIFLRGACQTCKTTLLKKLFPKLIMV